MNKRKFYINIKSKNFTIGIDRTFNVSEYYLTAMTYKNSRVVSNSTKSSPICVGPIMLHKQSHFREYSLLMSCFKIAINSDISSENMGNWESAVTFGTDGELALTKAIKSSFPNCKNRLCYMHLKKNIDKKMIVFNINLINLM